MQLNAKVWAWACGVTVALALSGCPKDKPKEPADAGATANCLQMAKDQKSVAPQETIDCLCEKCIEEMQFCNMDDGCIEIRNCSDRTGCRGNACYFGNKECMAIIDKWGSTSPSVTYAQDLNDCNVMKCMGGGGLTSGAGTGGSAGKGGSGGSTGSAGKGGSGGSAGTGDDAGI
jgi:hypothetical protein